MIHITQAFWERPVTGAVPRTRPTERDTDRRGINAIIPEKANRSPTGPNAAAPAGDHPRSTGGL